LLPADLSPSNAAPSAWALPPDKPKATTVEAPSEKPLDLKVDIVLELLDKLWVYCLSGDELLDVSPTVAVEHYPLRYPDYPTRDPQSVFAYQFLLGRHGTLVHPVVNIATCIPDMKTSRTDWIQLHPKGGKAYATTIKTTVNMTPLLCASLLETYENSRLIQAVEQAQSELGLRGARLNLLSEMIQTEGVFPTMRMLRETMPVEVNQDRHEESPRS
jgi:hypothetical protein